jgi:glycosyltransferase involved in cell wall biosynthesis
VIASRTGGLSELVEDNVNGLLVPPDDVRAWRAAVARLLDDGESERLGRGAYECWQKRFSPSIATRRLEDSYAAAGASGDLRRSRGQHPDRQSVERPAA